MLKHLLCCVLLCLSLPVVAEDGARLPGKFVWAELVTDDVVAAQHFYSGLFGWTFTTVDDYTTVYNGEEAVAGMFFHARPANSVARPRWISYVSSNDLAATAQKVLSAGGSVRVPPQQVPMLGERVIFADAEGALFGAMRLQGDDPGDYLAEAGSWIWLQLLSLDVKRAADFYHAVGGYALFEDKEAGEGQRYLLARDDYARAAILPLSPKRRQEGVQPMWLPFIRVDNVRVTVARVSALRGKIVVPPRDTLFDGRVALLEDPTGSLIGIMEWDAEAVDDEQGRAP